MKKIRSPLPKWENFSKSSRIFLVLISSFIVLASLFTMLKNPKLSEIKAATYGWIQNNWDGGADTAAVATHITDQTGWNKYYSKTDNIGVINGELTQINPAPDAWVETEDADFSDRGVGPDIFILNGTVQPKKPDGVACTTHDECLGKCSTDGNCLECDKEITDGSGNKYNTVAIERQCWMASNLRTKKRADGVLNVSYRYPGGTSFSETLYGLLYKWGAAMINSTTPGVQGICPNGWHIPTDAEWSTLETFYSTTTCLPTRISSGALQLPRS